jgi:hypothetical protein
MIRVEITIERLDAERIEIREEVPFYEFEVEARAVATRELAAKAVAKALAADAAGL